MLRDIKVGITGVPGAGKTTAILKVIELLENENIKVGGMITEPILRGDVRLGFNVMDWETKELDVFAHVNIPSEIRVGKYGLNLEPLEKIGVKALENAISNSDVIIVDEVGKMELESNLFVEIVKKAIDTEKPIVLTLHKKSRNPLLQEIRRRDNVRILEVTAVNKSLLPYRVVKLLKFDNE